MTFMRNAEGEAGAMPNLTVGDAGSAQVRRRIEALARDEAVAQAEAA